MFGLLRWEKLESLKSRIVEKGKSIKRGLDFIQAWSHYQDRNKQLIEHHINGREAPIKLNEYRMEISQLAIKCVIMEDLIAARPGMKKKFIRITKQLDASIQSEINKAKEKELQDDSQG